MLSIHVLRLAVYHIAYQLILHSVKAQILSTFNGIHEWAAREEKIFGLAKARIKRLQLELFELEGYVKDYEETTLRHLAGLKEELVDNNELSRAIVASNALLIHRMSHRCAIRIPRMQRTILKQDIDGQMLKEILGEFVNPETDPNLEPVGEHFGKFHDELPSEKDMDDSILSLVNLYDTYSTYLAKVPYGFPNNFNILISKYTNHPVDINAYHASKLSLTSFYHGMYGNAIDWIVYAQKRLATLEDDTISRDVVMYMKEYMVKMHNEEWDKANGAASSMAHLSLFDSKVDDSTFSEGSPMTLKRKHIQMNSYVNNGTRDKKNIAYYTLCQGETSQLDRNTRLKCYMEKNRHTFFVICPLKVEQLSVTPRILQFHDILTDKDIADTAQAVRGKWKESTVISRQDFNNRIRELPPKTLVEANLELSEVPHVGRKAELLTGLTITGNGVSRARNVERVTIKVGEAVAGRHFRLVTEFSSSDDKRKTGGHYDYERVAVVQFHMNDVQRGGLTVFGNVGASGHPSKGSAIYWENGQDVIWYGGCPVIEGYKTTLTMWLQLQYSL